ncbi:MAG: 30S ribosomal protein S4, partial [Candidatus Bipolaricaulota bacterium]
RRERTKLFLKGEKCYTDKCPIERRPYPPGETGGRRSRSSQYRVRLREKQKARHMFGLREKQFRQYIEDAKESKEVTGDRLLQTLERRLDNVLYKAGLASSHDQARQLINHGHVEVNGRSVDTPSHLVEEDDLVAYKENSSGKRGIKQIVEENQDRNLPEWLNKDPNTGEVTVLTYPDPEELREDLTVNLIVEFYSR